MANDGAAGGKLAAPLFQSDFQALLMRLPAEEQYENAVCITCRRLTNSMGMPFASHAAA